MIGVVLKPAEAGAAEELFQLFKTPWEVYREGKSYDVVVATADRVPRTAPKLLVIYGSEPREGDGPVGTTNRPLAEPVVLDYLGVQLPIYGAVLTFRSTVARTPVLVTGAHVAGFRAEAACGNTLRIGYDLLREVELLLSGGQPAKWARVPTLEIHIRVLRETVLAAGLPLLEIPPLPAGYAFQACLTHDIDFAGIRFHKFDHSMWGFLYRSTVGGLRDFVRRRISARRLLRMWRAATSLPFVYLGVLKDFWIPFEWYLRVEKDLPTTYFVIPFKHRAGERLRVKHPERRAVKYDISDIPQWAAALISAGCEIGVHGIDAWHSAERGRDEIDRIASVTQAQEIGVRMHWLLHDEGTYKALDDAGYAYDSTAGYNETIGYRSGTTQVFQPANTRRLLELPLHIQDGALFYPQQLGLTEAEAWTACEEMLEQVKELGGVLTVLWHDRSHGPERFWGDFYVRLIETLRASKVWFGSAGQVVQWFRRRRDVRFLEVPSADGSTQLTLSYKGGRIEPPLTVRAYQSRMPLQMAVQSSAIDHSWNGENPLAFTQTSDGFAIAIRDAGP